MDLIAQLSSQLDLDPGQAKGLAGTILSKVGEMAGPQAATAIETARPPSIVGAIGSLS